LERLIERLRRAATLPPYEVLQKALAKAQRSYHWRRERERDFRACTFDSGEVPSGPLASFFGRYPTDAVVDPVALGAVGTHYLAHRFDLLGSGWVGVRHGMECRGLEGHRYDVSRPCTPDPEGAWLEALVTPGNLIESQRIWRLVDPGYQAIDWQRDFKSGYRWSERTWYRDIAYGHLPGVDVKVPWELARMQHLPQLAGVEALADPGRVAALPSGRYAREFRNQVLDFIATNPPRFGVNWATTMDVAIRVANWLAAYDLFRASGTEFDSVFETVFRRSVLQHGRHIVANLEWTVELRGNHYLANVVGLLFVAAYLPRSAETDVWLAFAVQQVIAEAEYQFTSDGANFEASTCYHRLSAEQLIYTTALILGFGPDQIAALRDYDHRQLDTTPSPRPGPMPLYLTAGRQSPLPPGYLERVERMAEFTMHITKPNGRVPQIGDNDSGRFLKLVPRFRSHSTAAARARYTSLDGYTGLPQDSTYWEEDHLDHTHLIAAAHGLFRRSDFAESAGDSAGQSRIVADLARDLVLPSMGGQEYPAERVRIGEAGTIARLEARLGAMGAEHYRHLAITLPGTGLWDGLQLLAYPDFGLYLFRSSSLYLAVRCGPIGQNGLGGHAHNDQLHVELTVNGEDWIADPGTYVYTPLPIRRNEYRSTRAHFTPRMVGPEPARLDLGLFRLGGESRASCLYWGPEGFAGAVQSGRRTATCIVRPRDDAVIVVHAAEGSRLEEVEQADWRSLYPAVAYSPGYGIVRRES
jgi:hypothetical protein